MKNRIAIITGASAGIGEAIVREFASQGISCVINARRQERLDALQASLLNAEGKIVCCPGDASEQKTIDALFQTALDNFGQEPDLVVVNAGRGLAGSIVTADLEQFEAVLKVNMIGAVRLMQTASRRMTKAGEEKKFPLMPRDIVVLGSTVGRHISPFSAVYGATKFGVNSLAEALRREMGPKGVRVTLIEPGVVKSEFQAVAEYSDETVLGFEERFGPLLVGEDIARTIAFIVAQAPHVHINDVVIRPTRQEYP